MLEVPLLILNAFFSLSQTEQLLRWRATSGQASGPEQAQHAEVREA